MTVYRNPRVSSLLKRLLYRREVSGPIPPLKQCTSTLHLIPGGRSHLFARAFGSRSSRRVSPLCPSDKYPFTTRPFDPYHVVDEVRTLGPDYYFLRKGISSVDGRVSVLSWLGRRHSLEERGEDGKRRRVQAPRKVVFLKAMTSFLRFVVVMQRKFDLTNYSP